MARWHVTTSEVLHARASEVCDAAELRPCGEDASGGLFVRSYSKRAVDNVNFESFGPDQWVCVAGTLIVDGELGKGALPLLYRRFVEDGLEAARAGAIGHYAVALRRGDSVFAFTDEEATLRLYYASPAPGEHVLSNSLHVVASALGGPEIDPIGFIAATFHNEAVGEDTFYQGVKRIFGSQLIEIDVPSGGMRVHDVPQRMDELAAEDLVDIARAVTVYADRVRGVFAQIVAQPSVGLNTTGGLDTRTVLAGLVAEGGKPLLMYGVGNSELTNTKTADLHAARQISAALSLPLYEMDWSGRQPHSDEALSSLFRKYGFLYTAYSASENFLAEMEGGISPYPALQLGGYSPALTNKKPWEDAHDKFDLEYLVKDVSSYAKYLTPKARADYKAYLMQAVRQAVGERSSIEFPWDGATVEQFVRARLHLHLPMASSNPNFFNEFAFYLSPFFIKRLNDPLVTVPPDFRRDDRFQVRLIHELAPDVLKVPVFSGVQPRVIDTSTFTMRQDIPAALAHGVKRGAPLPVRLARLGGRLLPRRLRRVVRRGTLFWSRLGIRGMTDELVKDARVSARVRRDTIKRVGRHPLVAGLFESLDFAQLSRLYVLRMRLHAVDEVARQSAAAGRRVA